MSNLQKNRPIILFDGVCNLCHSSVRFIIKHDKKKQFLFASLQSEVGKGLLEKSLLSTDDLNSLVLIESDNCFTNSTAVLKVAKYLKYPINLFYIFIVVPKPFRDTIYRYIAKNRYKWFGKQDQCMMPTPELKKRFIDQ